MSMKRVLIASSSLALFSVGCSSTTTGGTALAGAGSGDVVSGGGTGGSVSSGSNSGGAAPGAGSGAVVPGGAGTPAAGGMSATGTGGAMTTDGGAMAAGGDMSMAGASTGMAGADMSAGGADMGGGGVSAGGVGGGGGTPPGPEVTVQLADVRQLIRGFGINNNWQALGSAADELFGNGEGQLGMNILRVGMGIGLDGAPYNGDSCYDDIKKVRSLGAQYIMGTTWSPPGDWKINADGSPHASSGNSGGINDGGHLDPAHYQDQADRIIKFVDLIEQKTGEPLYAMSPQNEVDFASCGLNEPCNGNYDTTLMTGAEAAAFMKVVGPMLRAKGVIPMSPEASEWIHVWSNESASGSMPSGLPSSDPLQCGFPADNPNCLTNFGGYDYGHALHADPDAWAAFDIMGTHEYDTQYAEPWPADIPRDKEVWQTEMSGVKWWPEQGEVDASGKLTTCSTHIENGVAVARWIHSALTVGEASAWLYWWYRALGTDDNEGLLCSSSGATKTTTPKRFYTFGQFSKYVRPGYHRVNMTGDVPDKVLLSAYLGDDGTVVVVAINETTSAQEIPITIAGGTGPAEMTPIQTSASAELASQTAVPVTGGIFNASLPAMSVTTFVGK